MTFLHSDDSPDDARRLAGALATTPLLGPPGEGDHLVVVAAHPDDETLGAGGLICAAVCNGAAVTVIVATDGDASHPHSPTHTPADLARRRRHEVEQAIVTLAPAAAAHFLGLPDGTLAEHAAALGTQVDHFTRTATHIVCPWREDRHPDHEACAQAALAAAGRHGAACWQYPIWAWHWADPTGDDLPWARVRRVVLDDVDQATKTSALQCHASQHLPLSDRPGDEAVLAPGMLAHFSRPFETFVVESTEPANAATPGFFDALYAQSSDPWGLESRFYEQRKRAILLDSLPRKRFARAFEPGCALGLLTVELAARCDEVVAWDVSEEAVRLTAQRLDEAVNVAVERGGIPDAWPPGRFDLVVVSEVGYYCRNLDDLVGAVDDCLSADGVVVGCHWRHPASMNLHDARTVHDSFAERFETVVSHVERDFLLHVWTRSGRSVAAETGVLA